MLAQWLAPDNVDEFLQNVLQKQPYARPGAAATALPLLQWSTLDGVLGSQRPLDVMTVSQGQLVDVPMPRSSGDVQRLMRRGVSTVIRASEQHDADLAALAAAFGQAVPGEVHVQLYATPGGSNSYGWHYDFEHVFIAQTRGIKDYYFRENTVATHTALGDQLDFTVFRDERSPLFSSQLVAGDWLYIPARWWHLVKCVEDSLSISIGVMPPEELRAAKRLPRGWSGLTTRP